MAKAKTPIINPDFEAQIKTLNENWKRALADYQNLLRRVDQDKKEYSKFVASNLIANLIPTLDIMEMAASHTQDIGVQMAAKQFLDVLVGEGVKIILPIVGDVFDPTLHECVETLPVSPDSTADTIAELVLKGYKLYDYVIRPAKVKVFK
jgi:molecular chaperone GrpE